MNALPVSSAQDVLHDVRAVQRMGVVPKLLEVVTHVTGLRFAAIARVTDHVWVACAVKDDMAFGLSAGQSIPLETTICNEIRQHRTPVAFGHASTHPHFSTHPTPLMYGLESYISVPIMRGNGELFGTLCAIDSRPSKADAPEMIKLLELFAELISLQLQADDASSLRDAALDGALEGAVRREHFVDETAAQVMEQVQGGLYATYALKSSENVTDDALEQLTALETSLWRISSLMGDTTDKHASGLVSASDMADETAIHLSAVLEHAFERVRHRYPGRAFSGTCSIDADVECDAAQIAQLLEELVSNVMRNQPSRVPVEAAAFTSADELLMTVRAAGLEVSDRTLERVSDTRSRRVPPAGDGECWDLFVAEDIVRCHGGSLRVDPVRSDTIVFRMPRVR